MKRIAQPPIDPRTRPAERRGFGPGLTLAVLGALAAFFGLGRITDVETLQGSLAIEREIHVAFAHGGVRYADYKPPGPGSPDGVWTEDREATSTSSSKSRRLLFRIDTAAKDPCPT